MKRSSSFRLWLSHNHSLQTALQREKINSPFQTLNVSPYKSPMKDLGSVLLPRSWTTPHRSSTLAFTFLEEIPSCCVTNVSTLTDSHRPAVSGALTYLLHLYCAAWYGPSHSLQEKGSMTLPVSPARPTTHCSFTCAKHTIVPLGRITESS